MFFLYEPLIAGMVPGTCNYENDEGEYVVLNDNPICLRISMYASKRIVATDIYTIQSRNKQVEEHSPVLFVALLLKRTGLLCNKLGHFIAGKCDTVAKLSSLLLSKCTEKQVDRSDHS